MVSETKRFGLLPMRMYLIRDVGGTVRRVRPGVVERIA